MSVLLVKVTRKREVELTRSFCGLGVGERAEKGCRHLFQGWGQLQVSFYIMKYL